MAVITQKQAGNVANRVGRSYGERRDLQNQVTAQTPQRPAVQQQLDQFGGTVGTKQEDILHTPNARYAGTWARVSSRDGTPYRKPEFENREIGRQRAQVGNRPSDTAILNFLNRVIVAPAKAPVAAQAKTASAAPTVRTAAMAAPAAQRTVASKAQAFAPNAAQAARFAPRVAAAPARHASQSIANQYSRGEAGGPAARPQARAAVPVAKAAVRQASPGVAGAPARRVAPQAAIPVRQAAAPIAAQRFAAQAPIARPQIRKA